MTIRKYEDLTTKEMNRLEEAIESAEAMFWRDERPLDGKHGDFGICAGCTHYMAAEHEFGVAIAVCGKEFMARKLNSAKPVLSCNCYSDRYEMDLWLMKSRAIMIDAPEREAGFTGKGWDTEE